MLDLQIQIINYNSVSYLKKCTDSILADLKDSPLTYKIFILDNGSQDDLTPIKNLYKNENLEFFYSKENLGFSAGHNFLSGKGNSKALLFVNPDTEIQSNGAIEKLFSFLFSDKHYAVVGPKMVSKWGGPRTNDHAEIKGLIARIFNYLGQIWWFPRRTPTEVFWVEGSFFLVKKDLFVELGGFDERFFLYCEEVDLCKRLIDKGCKVFYYPPVKVVHTGSGSFVNRLTRYKMLHQSHAKYLDKHMKNPQQKMVAKLLSRITLLP